MVTVDDATYVAMRDNLYKGDAGAASRAKAKIESSYSQQQYDSFLSQLNGMSGSTPKTTTTTTTRATPQDTSRDQGNGNYVYNPNTGYYEKEGTARATQTTPTTKQDTTIKGGENNGSTVSKVKQEGALTPMSQEYYNQTNDVALNQIRDNLNRYRQSNPEYFTTYEDFQKNFSYNARNEEQKALLDNWYKGYQQGLSLASTPTTDLYTQYQNGNISSEQLEQLRISDPTKYSELMSQINKGNIVAAYDDDKGEKNSFDKLRETRIQNMINNLTTAGSQASDIFDSYEEKMNSPEMTELSDKTTELQEQIENIQDDIATMTKAVEKEYEGTGASKSKINAIVADRTYDLQLQLRTLNNEYNKYANQYNNRMNQYQTEFSMELQEYQINQQERQMQMQEMGFAMDLMSFETPEQAQERQWNYWVKQQQYANGDINSKDQATRMKAALNSVNDLLSQYNGIPMVRSPEQMAEDILKDIDNGLTLGEALTKINKQIQQKPEYKQAYNQTYGGGSSFAKPETFKIGDKDYVIWNNQLISADEFNKMYNQQGQGKYYMPVSEDKLSMTVNPGDKNLGKFITLKGANGMKGGQCGKYVNDYLEYIGMGRYYDDDLSTKLNSINTYSPVVGGIAVFDYGHESSDGVNHGHVGIVVGIDEKNRTITIKDSNFGSDEKIQTRTISMNDPALRGFFDPTKPYGSSSSSTGSDLSDKKAKLSDEDRIRAESILKQIKTGGITNTDISKERDWLINNGYGEEFQEALNKGLALQLTDTQKSLYTTATDDFNNSQLVKDFQKAANQIGNLITSLDANNGVGDLAGIFQFMKVLDPNSTVRESEFENAARTAGFANPKALYQNYIKHGWDGTYLTEGQRGNFAILAKEIIKNQAESYNFEYDKMKQTFKNAGIDNQWLPQNYADFILNKLGNQNTVQDRDAGLAKSGGGELTQSNTYVNVLGYELNSDWNKIPVIGGPRANR